MLTRGPPYCQELCRLKQRRPAGGGAGETSSPRRPDATMSRLRARSSAVEPSVRLIPLGGLGEIGLNMMLIESGDDVIAVDCGLMFPDDELPGVDYVIPDFSYALAKREGFHGVVLTHGHEDHIGALPYLLKSARVPVYATPLTRAFVAEKLREHVLPEPADLRLMRPREPFALGPFTIEPIRVTHSIAEIGRASCRARVETAGGATPREKKKAEPAR